jgi:hypothetical protein
MKYKNFFVWGFFRQCGWLTGKNTKKKINRN